MEQNRLFAYMSDDEARDAAANDVDIQLHTHRHLFPDDGFEFARKEIEDNRRALGGIAAAPLRHFCYPSGEYTDESLSYLSDLDIDSATTTFPGFIRTDTPRYELPRFLDSEAVSDLEFEAEMTGFLELIRRTGYSI